MPAAEGPDGRGPAAWAGYAACAWALLFALVGVYWAAGGMAGVGTLAEPLRDEADARTPGFVTLLWITAALKGGAALLALALAHPADRSCPAVSFLWPVGRRGCS